MTKQSVPLTVLSKKPWQTHAGANSYRISYWHTTVWYPQIQCNSFQKQTCDKLCMQNKRHL